MERRKKFSFRSRLLEDHFKLENVVSFKLYLFDLSFQVMQSYTKFKVNWSRISLKSLRTHPSDSYHGQLDAPWEPLREYKKRVPVLRILHLTSESWALVHLWGRLQLGLNKLLFPRVKNGVLFVFQQTYNLLSYLLYGGGNQRYCH